jgi:phage recombination protein Bet
MTTTNDRALAERRQQHLERANYGDITALVGWSVPEIQTIKRTVAPGIRDDELLLFAQVCKRTGLDPFTRQIYAIIYNAERADRKMVIQVGIDGFRALAAETGRYLGSTEPQWCDDDGTWWDVWLHPSPPRACKVGVYVKDAPAPTYHTVMWSEFGANSRNPKYKEMPAQMLAVRAESHALRKAFPKALAGTELLEDVPGPAPERRSLADVHAMYPPEDAIEGQVVQEQAAAPARGADRAFRERLDAPPRPAPTRSASGGPNLAPRIPRKVHDAPTETIANNGNEMRALHARAKKYGLDHDALRAFAAGILEVEDLEAFSLTTLTYAQWWEVYQALRPDAESGAGGNAHGDRPAGAAEEHAAVE